MQCALEPLCLKVTISSYSARNALGLAIAQRCAGSLLNRLVVRSNPCRCGICRNAPLGEAFISAVPKWGTIHALACHQLPYPNGQKTITPIIRNGTASFLCLLLHLVLPCLLSYTALCVSVEQQLRNVSLTCDSHLSFRHSWSRSRQSSFLACFTVTSKVTGHWPATSTSHSPTHPPTQVTCPIFWANGESVPRNPVVPSCGRRFGCWVNVHHPPPPTEVCGGQGGG